MTRRSHRSTQAHRRTRRINTARNRLRAQFHSPPAEGGVEDVHDLHTVPDPNSIAGPLEVDEHVQILHDISCEKFQQTFAAEVRDGTGLLAVLPTHYSGPAANGVLDTILEIFLDTIQRFHLNELVDSIIGLPLPEQVKQLENKFDPAVVSCRTALCESLGCSPRGALCGAPVRADLLRVLLGSIHDPDVGLATTTDEGVSLGIDSPVERTGVFPVYDKKENDLALEQLRLRVMSNYKSVDLNPGATEDLIKQEVLLGRMRPLSPDESLDPSRSFAKMALLEKKVEGAAVKPSYRIIEDYRRNTLNAQMVMPETVSLPRLQDLRSGLADCLSGLEKEKKSFSRRVSLDGIPEMPGMKDPDPLNIKFFEYDITSAFRHLFVRKADRRRLCVRVRHCAYEHLALPFGTKVAPFHWCRLAGGIVRIQKALLDRLLSSCPHLDFIYVDDGLLALPLFAYSHAVALCLLLWLCLGIQISWKKCRFNSSVAMYIGFQISVNDDSISIHIRSSIVDSAKTLISTLILSFRAKKSAVASLCGKLVFVTQVAPYLRSFLQPYYAILGIMEKKHTGSLDISTKSECYKVSLFWQTALDGDGLFVPVIASASHFVEVRHVVGCSDACTYGVGGFVAVPCFSGVYFAKRLSPLTMGPWQSLLEDPTSISHRDMTLMELIAACCTVSCALSFMNDLTSRSGSPLFFHLFTDNSSIVSTLSKLYSPSSRLSSVLRNLAGLLSRCPAFFDVTYIKGPHNWVADSLSRGVYLRVPETWTLVSPDIDFPEYYGVSVMSRHY